MVVGIGASAGGIQALQAFFAALPDYPGIVFTVVMHLSPEHESNLPQVVQPHTAMPVEQVRGHIHMEPDHVYVIPPNQNCEIVDRHIILTDFEEARGRYTPIDVLFHTLAENEPHSVGILLSGSGSDGTLGMQALKANGGVVMVQSPEEAEDHAMPRSAMATGLVDFVLPAAALAVKLLELRQYGMPDDALAYSKTLSEPVIDMLRQILWRLEIQTGYDFSGYKHTAVLRRLDRRMRVLQMETLSAYLTYLHSQAHEAQVLMKDLLISVTRFFRDPEAFEALREQIIPRLFEGKTQSDEVRVWVPGCATGEEAYSIAMLLLEQADTLAVRPGIRLFASDLDEGALLQAREGLYPETIAADVSEARLQRFFVRERQAYRVKKELRDVVIFASHSLIKDPPFSRLDLISCRNLLIYLQRGLQEQVVELFHYALQPEGDLFLGSAERPEGIAKLFHVIDPVHHLFRRQPTHALAPLPDLPMSVTMPRRMRSSRSRLITPQQVASDAELHRQVLETHAPPSLIVDAEANVVHISETATRYLQFPRGSPSLNLYRVALPELRQVLKGALYRALEEAEATISTPMAVEIQGDRRLVQLYVMPSCRSPDSQRCQFSSSVPAARKASPPICVDVPWAFKRLATWDHSNR
jgi:two-component system CheB/CheR fusion protein